MRFRNPAWRDAVLAAAFAGFVAAVLPFQTYLSNRELFAFAPGRLAAECAVLWLALAGIAWLLMATVGRFLGGALQALFVALLVCAYAESGPLSAGLPEVSGGPCPELASASRAIWDSAVWAAVLVAFVATCRWTREWLHWVALGVLAISVGSLFDVRRTAPEPSAADVRESGVVQLEHGFEWQRDVLENFRYSPRRNVLVFVLDSMPGNLAADLMERDAALRARFGGFTAYVNSVGMHDCTKFGLPGLVTGRYFEPGTSSIADYPMSLYGADSFLLSYVNVGAEVFFVPDLLPYGYTNARVERRVKIGGRQKHGWSAMLLRTREVPYISMLDFAVYRMTPYAAKAWLLYQRIRRTPMPEGDEAEFWYEHAMYAMLAKAGLSESDLTLGVFHSRGAHPPLVFDPDGRRYPEPQVRTDMVEELVSTPIRQLAKLMDALRERGLYDSSLIVVVADHGTNLAPCAPGHEPSESAILWVKPEGAGGGFAVDSRPTGYSKVSGFLKAAVGESPRPSAVGGRLHEECRLYRYQRGSGFAELTVGPEGEVRK